VSTVSGFNALGCVDVGGEGIVVRQRRKSTPAVARIVLFSFPGQGRSFASTILDKWMRPVV
jgi:hypothetical protein